MDSVRTAGAAGSCCYQSNPVTMGGGWGQAVLCVSIDTCSAAQGWVCTRSRLLGGHTEVLAGDPKKEDQGCSLQNHWTKQASKKKSLTNHFEGHPFHLTHQKDLTLPQPQMQAALTLISQPQQMFTSCSWNCLWVPTDFYGAVHVAVGIPIGVKIHSVGAASGCEIQVNMHLWQDYFDWGARKAGCVECGSELIL